MGRGIGRRRLLQLLGGAVAPRLLAQDRPTTVGVGVDEDPYEATRRAVESAGNWSALPLAGAKVIIKPNLVVPRPASSGATTDPEVVRAIVDLALAGGAAEILIIEGGPEGAPFDACGYTFFSNYDGSGRVRLVDLENEPHSLAPVPQGFVYQQLHWPDILRTGNPIFISVPKLKTHSLATATLSIKNLFGLPQRTQYIANSAVPWRFAMHERGLPFATLDLAKMQPIHYAVIDGIWGMEGQGPSGGTPKRMNTVLAGISALGVDTAAASLMGIPITKIRHLTYAYLYGNGPTRLIFAGDPFTPQPFALPALPPVLHPPTVLPTAFRPGTGQTVNLYPAYGEAVWREVRILRLNDTTVEAEVVRTVAALGFHAAGTEPLSWDGRDESGALAPPGRYAVHLSCWSVNRKTASRSFALNWVSVI